MLQSTSRPCAALLPQSRFLATAAAREKIGHGGSDVAQPGGKGVARHHTELKMTRLPSNGLMVTTVDSGKPVSRLGLVFRAGSRYESPEQRGVAHRVRNCFGLGTMASTQIGLLWRAGMIGSNMGATLTRDYLFLELDVIRDHASEALAILGEAACQPAFKTWELEETEEAIMMETKLMKQSGSQRCMELLHKAAYRNGPLGNPLYCPKKLATSFGSEVLQKFSNDHLLSGEAALIGLDVDHELVLSFAADNLDIKNGKGTTQLFTNC